MTSNIPERVWRRRVKIRIMTLEAELEAGKEAGREAGLETRLG